MSQDSSFQKLAFRLSDFYSLESDGSFYGLEPSRVMVFLQEFHRTKGMEGNSSISYSFRRFHPETLGVFHY